MDLEQEVCFRALSARDSRFDGVFFVGVTTTGIYCRPVCPARTPGRDRCRFFAHAAAAERDGFRPCLRCRPELAPGLAAVDSARRLAQLAAERIEAGALNNGGSLESLADELQVSSRQLRRVVRQAFGVSPIELAQTRRLLLAKQLLTETDIPVIDAALASGFESVRRFNALFRSRYGLTPTQMRKSVLPAPDPGGIRLSVAYRPPLAWQPLLQFLSARSTAGVEQVGQEAYFRTVALDGCQGWIKVEQLPKRDALAVTMAIELLPVLPQLLSRIRRLFDVDARPDIIAAHLGADARLAESVRATPGLRVPGAFDEFELVVRAILGQRISVKAATTLAGRLAQTFGDTVDTPFAGLNRLSPSAEQLARPRTSRLVKLGIAAARADCIRGVARAVSRGKLELAAAADPQCVMGALKELPGIGEWTAQYVAMRALHWPDAFPSGDLGLLRAAGQQTPQALNAIAAAWRPWRAYGAMYLWKK